jgi:hypothetical protein
MQAKVFLPYAFYFKRHVRTRASIVAGIVCVYFLFIAPNGVSLNYDFEASIHRVPSEYATIQEAVDASSDGDVVLVAPGTYTGDGNKNIDFSGKAIVVRSELGSYDTAIDWATLHRSSPHVSYQKIPLLPAAEYLFAIVPTLT